MVATQMPRGFQKEVDALQKLSTISKNAKQTVVRLEQQGELTDEALYAKNLLLTIAEYKLDEDEKQMEPALLTGKADGDKIQNVRAAQKELEDSKEMSVRALQNSNWKKLPEAEDDYEKLNKTFKYEIVRLRGKMNERKLTIGHLRLELLSEHKHRLKMAQNKRNVADSLLMTAGSQRNLNKPARTLKNVTTEK